MSIHEKRRFVFNKIEACISNNPTEACKIAAETVDLFSGIYDELSADFFWYYGSALEILDGDENLRKAIDQFDRCYRARQELYGEENWYTALANRESSVFRVLLNEDTEATQYDLIDFVESAIERSYANMPNDEYAVDTIIAKTLFVMLKAWAQRADMRDYAHYLSVYFEVCHKYPDSDDTGISLRAANMFLSYKYLYSQDYILAEDALISAINSSIVASRKEIYSLAEVKSELLQIYALENNTEKAFELYDELIGYIESDCNDKEAFLSDWDIIKIHTSIAMVCARNFIEPEEERINIYRELLREAGNNFANDTVPSGIGLMYALFIHTVVVLFNQQGLLREDEPELCYQALKKIACNPDQYQLNHIHAATLCITVFCMSQKVDAEFADEYYKMMMRQCEGDALPFSVKYSAYSAAAEWFYNAGDREQAEYMVLRALDSLDEDWIRYAYYLNDERLNSVLIPAFIMFFGVYETIHRLCSVRSAYESVLNHKLLASLVGRIRNRILQTSTLDPKLLDRIHYLQDEIAQYESASMYREVKNETINDKRAELRSLEAEAVRQFPAVKNHQAITFEMVEKALPDNSVVLEYFYFPMSESDAYSDGSTPFDRASLDVYVLKKKDGVSTIQRVVLSGVSELLERVNSFVSILIADSKGDMSLDQMEIKEPLRGELFRRLIKPVLHHLDGIRTVYFAPDQDLINLPLEILYDESDDYRFEERYNIIRIECARDLLYVNSTAVSSSGSLIIGNPAYLIDEKRLTKERERTDDEELDSTRSFTKNIDSLPFSGLEIKRVASYCNADYYEGRGATKHILLRANGYRNVHIATHGGFDLNNQTSSLFSSMLLFAGAKNHVENGAVFAEYGNGIVTADEISRMNLQSTELVVLSSCYGAMNENLGVKCLSGLVGAFSAAGVNYVVSHLWEANDFSIAVFMDAFYRFYINEKETPPVALVLAKEYLKSVTIEMLTEMNWFGDIDKLDLKEESKAYIENMRHRKGSHRPFSNEVYWSGFFCYRCN